MYAPVGLRHRMLAAADLFRTQNARIVSFFTISLPFYLSAVYHAFSIKSLLFSPFSELFVFRPEGAIKNLVEK